MSIQIKGMEGMAPSDIQRELENGAKFVMYQYAISIVVMTFRRSSSIHFIRAGSSAVVPGLGWTLLTLVLGWWGIPWGPIYTIGSLFTNLTGGKNVTQEVIHALATPEEETAEDIAAILEAREAAEKEERSAQ